MQQIKRIGGITQPRHHPKPRILLAVAFEGERRHHKQGRREPIAQGLVRQEPWVKPAEQKKPERSSREGRCHGAGRTDARQRHMPDEHAEAEFQNDRPGPEIGRRQRRRHHLTQGHQQHQHENHDRYGALARQRQGQREEAIEEHLVIERPAKPVNRLHKPIRPQIGDEGQRRRNFGGRWWRPVQRCEPAERQRDEQRRRGKVDRHNPRQPAAQKRENGLRRAEEVARGIDHHETGDDEEEIDARLQRQRVLPGEAAAGLPRHEISLVQAVVDDDGQCRNGAQNLDRGELGDGSACEH